MGIFAIFIYEDFSSVPDRETFPSGHDFYIPTRHIDYEMFNEIKDNEKNLLYLINNRIKNITNNP